MKSEICECGHEYTFHAVLDNEACHLMGCPCKKFTPKNQSQCKGCSLCSAGTKNQDTFDLSEKEKTGVDITNYDGVKTYPCKPYLYSEDVKEFIKQLKAHFVDYDEGVNYWIDKLAGEKLR